MRYQAARASSAGRPSAARPTSGRTSHISLSRLSNFLNHTSRDGWALWIWKKAWRWRFCVWKLRDRICSRVGLSYVPFDFGFLPPKCETTLFFFFSSFFLLIFKFCSQGHFLSTWRPSREELVLTDFLRWIFVRFNNLEVNPDLYIFVNSLYW